jgi:predicted nucleotidyltransferase
MTKLEAALAEVARELGALGIPYALIGGLAVSLWGEPRATLDIDITVWVPPDRTKAVVEALCERFASVSIDPVGFVRGTHVLPVMTSQGVRADIVFATLPAEKELIERAHAKDVAGTSVRVASVEDLILMKLISERERDTDDARRLLRRFGKSLDRAYLQPRAAALAEDMARPEIVRAVAEAFAANQVRPRNP